ncbi:hypothetical protein ACPDHJ_12800 [Myroides sp. C8-3]|uniref:hypothetical protein n=1 Tax=Myroides sp. C8-3 TaxID=3400533 RepID=UPI003D2F609C
MMKKSVALFGTLIAFLALSCGGDTTIHLHEENNTAEIKAAVEKVFSPDLAITELVLSTPKLDTRLDQIAVVFWEGDKEYTQTYNQKNGLQEKSENNLMLQIEHIKKRQTSAKPMHSKSKILTTAKNMTISSKQ